MPHLDETEAAKLIKLRHIEWFEHQAHWRFLYDSLEGGNRYKRADYRYDPAAIQNLELGKTQAAPWYTGMDGIDPQTGQAIPRFYDRIVDRNLIPHPSEMAIDGRDIYQLRLERTPPPGYMSRGIDIHIAKIFGQNVKRTGPEELEGWWADVDGRGTTMDRWMQETVGPLLLALGLLDLAFDRPKLPAGETVKTLADENRLGLNSCVASIVLPENVLWWDLDDRGCNYEQVLVLERKGLDAWFRHLTDTDSNAYTIRGEWIPGKSREHDYGRVPMVRVFDRRKPRCDHVGVSRYEAVANLQKSIYNRQSELALSDVQQSHAILMVPERNVTNDGEMTIGPGNAFPISVDGRGNVLKAEYLDPPKGAQEALRIHIQDDKDEIDRIFGLAKPAGSVGGAVTAQSGVSKIMDSVDGNALLSSDSAALESLENTCLPFVMAVLDGPDADPAIDDTAKVLYPRKFELYTASDLAQASIDIQTISAGAGALPILQGEILSQLVRVLLPGLDDDRQEEIKAEQDAFMMKASAGYDSEPEPDPNSINEDVVQGVSVPS